MVGFIKSLLDDTADLFIHLAGRLLTVVALLTEVAAQENQLFLVTQGHWADATTHAILSDHGTRNLGYALDIVRCASSDLAKDNQFGHMTTQRIGEHILKLRLAP